MAIRGYPQSPQFRDGRFDNPLPIPTFGALKGLQLMWTAILHKPPGTRPIDPIPVDAIKSDDLLAAPDRSLYRLGHSTLLLKLRDKFWLTDPVFSLHASPVSWGGPKRFHAPPISIAELPPIEGVLLSHNHFDHLDRAAIKALAGKTTHFIAPLGVGDQLVEWGVKPAKVQQLDWWESTTVDGIALTCTPARHFSGRSPGQANRSLWCSWVIVDDDLRVYFSADSGYFDGFKAIGDRLGPFDLALVENGAYDVQWPDVHMQPEQTLQAFHDLRGKWLLPIHNGTFDLAMHRWQEPMERVAALALQQDIRLSTPRFGERVDMVAPHRGSAWWSGVR